MCQWHYITHSELAGRLSSECCGGDSVETLGTQKNTGFFGKFSQHGVGGGLPNSQN